MLMEIVAHPPRTFPTHHFPITTYYINVKDPLTTDVKTSFTFSAVTFFRLLTFLIELFQRFSK